MPVEIIGKDDNGENILKMCFRYTVKIRLRDISITRKEIIVKDTNKFIVINTEIDNCTIINATSEQVRAIEWFIDWANIEDYDIESVEEYEGETI